MLESPLELNDSDLESLAPVSLARSTRGVQLAYCCSRRASSASSAKSRRKAKNAFDWPMKSPMAVRKLRAPIAAPFVPVGRMMEHTGNDGLRNGQGSGMIRLVLKSSPP